MSRLCLRRAAFRVLSSSTASISTRSRLITTVTLFQGRTTIPRSFPSNFQRRWASGDETQSEPAADRETEAQHGDNSIAAASRETDIESSEHGDNASVTEAVKSAANTVSTTVADAAGQAAAAASSAVGSGSGASEEASSQVTKTIYIGNLFFDVKEQDLEKELSKAGKVLKTKIIYDQRGLSKGYASSSSAFPPIPYKAHLANCRTFSFGYVDFATLEEADRAISMFNMQNFEGRRMTVQHTIQKNRLQGRRPQTTREPHAPTKTLFIGNMAFDMSDRDLNNLFREIKNVVDVRVAIDRRTGQPRGFAHADFVDVESAEKAMAELADKEVCGRYLRVDFSASSRA